MVVAAGTNAAPAEIGTTSAGIETTSAEIGTMSAGTETASAGTGAVRNHRYHTRVHQAPAAFSGSENAPNSPFDGGSSREDGARRSFVSANI